MMLDKLGKEELVELAEANNVSVDKRWTGTKIRKVLVDAGVEAPESEKGDLVERLEREPVVFRANTGRIYVRDIPPAVITAYGAIEKAGLIVDFGEGIGTEARLSGGFSREFYPDLEEHDELDNYCSCKHCLEAVRDYIRLDRYGVCKSENVVEADKNPPIVPMGSATAWENVSPADLAELHEKLGFDIENAARYEKRSRNRAAILDALAAIEAKPEVQDEDILSAELEV